MMEMQQKQSERELALKMKEYINNLNYLNAQSKHYMPNEVFKDLQANIETNPHVAFAYSYYYLISWLYKTVKYAEDLPIEINTKTIKKLLGYNQNYKPINYIIKKNGVLEQINYIKNEWDYPVQFYKEDEQLQFTTISDVDDYEYETIHKNRRTDYEIKYPIKHFYRNTEDNKKTGIFYDTANTHVVPFEAFMHCMSSKNLGTTGFYLYAYLKYKNQLYRGGYDASRTKLAEETGISRRALTNYLNALRAYNMIEVIHNQDYFSLNIKDTKASTIKVNDPEKFTRYEIGYKKLPIKKKSEVTDTNTFIEKEEPQKPTHNSSFSMMIKNEHKQLS